MKRTICICDICKKEMVVKRQYALGYQFKSYLLTNSECKTKMDICSDCFDKFKTFVAEQLKGLDK